ncbi:MAG: hypothetical protein HOM37_02755 [Acidimicrobiaceae bacterium]|nr:hypothetical protein [Acidimicrobiaceae bacterium]
MQLQSGQAAGFGNRNDPHGCAWQFLRLTTAASGIQRVMRTLRMIDGRPGIKRYLVVTLASIFSGAGLTLAFEYDQAGSSINRFADAL